MWELEVRAREAKSVAHYGHTDLAYERAMNRLQQHGLQLGTKYLSAHFVELVEFLVAAAARARTADMLSEQLPSLGIASDVTLLFDGVSIGASQFSRHETLYLIGAHMHGQRSWPRDTRIAGRPRGRCCWAGVPQALPASQVGWRSFGRATPHGTGAG